MATTPTTSAAIDEADFDAPALPLDRYDEVPEGMEKVDGELVEKTDVTINHAAAQGNLVYAWRSYIISSGQGGKPYPEAPCRTDQQKRRPDVAYLTAELLAQYGQPNIFPQSYPLIGEVASPDDKAEELFSKAREYLRSGCEEVWLLFPENAIVIIITAEKSLIFTEAETVNTQTILQGFTIPVAELFA
ncbi:MAG: Uma2 family endonuclease [Stenomitos rutilans HA7619-LM2]|jgi:Uma2 family endonuclease|nr:Uma2 family endonuclease [Stenomitos rutilans HA7619-LM2]